MVRNMLHYLWAILIATSATIPSRINYGGDGTPGAARQSWVDMYAGEQSVVAGSDIAQSGVVDFLHTGRPFLQVEIIPAGVGVRSVEVLIQYFVREGDVLSQTGADRIANVAYFDYVPSPLVFNIPVKRELGSYCRVRTIANNGDSNFVAKVLAPSSVMPVEDSLEIQENEVIENVEI